MYLASTAVVGRSTISTFCGFQAFTLEAYYSERRCKQFKWEEYGFVLTSCFLQILT